MANCFYSTAHCYVWLVFRSIDPLEMRSFGKRPPSPRRHLGTARLERVAGRRSDFFCWVQPRYPLAPSHLGRSRAVIYSESAVDGSCCCRRSVQISSRYRHRMRAQIECIWNGRCRRLEGDTIGNGWLVAGSSSRLVMFHGEVGPGRCPADGWYQPFADGSGDDHRDVHLGPVSGRGVIHSDSLALLTFPVRVGAWKAGTKLLLFQPVARHLIRPLRTRRTWRL